MSLYYIFHPEVAGELGPSTELDISVHPPRVLELEYVFTGWMGDELIESFPCFLVSNRLGKWIGDASLSGFILRTVRITVSADFRIPEVRRQFISEFQWLDVQAGRPGLDFSTRSTGELVVSDRAKAVLTRARLDHCKICEI